MYEPHFNLVEAAYKYGYELHSDGLWHDKSLDPGLTDEQMYDYITSRES